MGSFLPKLAVNAPPGSSIEDPGVVSPFGAKPPSIRPLERQAVRGARHAKQHRDREYVVDARCVERRLARRRLLLVGGGLEAEDLLLVRPDQDPDVEQHDRAEPGADADDELVGVELVAAVSERECTERARAGEIPESRQPGDDRGPPEPG